MLVMHGGMGLDHTLFRPWLDPLSERLRLVYWDHRGNGRSPHDGPLEELTHARWVDDADALREAMGVERVVVFGHSYGGFLALEYALRHPRRVDALILANTAPVMRHGAAALENARRKGPPEAAARAETLLANPVGDDAAFLDGFRAILPLYFHRWRDEWADRLLGALVPNAATYDHANARCLPDYDVRGHLASLRMPTLVLSGADDWIMPREHAGDLLAAGIANADHIVFESSGHFPFVEERDAFVTTVREWLG